MDLQFQTKIVHCVKQFFFKRRANYKQIKKTSYVKKHFTIGWSARAFK